MIDPDERGLPGGTAAPKRPRPGVSAPIPEPLLRALLAVGERLRHARARSPRWALYAAGALAGVLGFLARYAFFDPGDHRFPYLLSFPVVVLCSGVLGFGPAVCCALVAGLLPLWAFGPFGAGSHPEDPIAHLGTVAYVGASLLVVGAVEVLGLAHAQARAHGAERDALLGRAERLLHELRHRTRNELMQIVSLLHLQAREATTEEERAALVSMVARVRAVGAVHDLLSDMMPHPDAPVDSGLFLSGLLARLRTLAPPMSTGVEVVAAFESHPLTHLVATPLGVVLAELWANAARHAFPPDHPKGRVVASFRRDAEAGEFVLEVRDDGVGMASSAAAQDAAVAAGAASPRRGIGERVMKGLALNLKASLLRRDAAPGTLCALRFPAPPPPAAALAEDEPAEGGSLS